MHLISNKTYFGALEPIGQLLRATSHMRLNACDHCTSSTLSLSLVEKVELLQVRFTLRLRDQQSMWMQGGCKVYMDFYMASNGSYFTVSWTIFKNHLLEVGLKQNWETITLQMLISHNHWFIQYLYHVWGPAWLKKFLKQHLVEGPCHIRLDTTLEGPWPPH